MSLTALYVQLQLAEHRLNNLERRINDGINITNSYRRTGHSNTKLLCGDGDGESPAEGKRIPEEERG